MKQRDEKKRKRDLLKIAEAIEHLRLQLEMLAARKDLQDPEVIRLSQELDKLIVEYYTGGGKADKY
jgi:hypothetical protein